MVYIYPAVIPPPTIVTVVPFDLDCVMIVERRWLMPTFPTILPRFPMLRFPLPFFTYRPLLFPTVVCPLTAICSQRLRWWNITLARPLLLNMRCRCYPTLPLVVIPVCNADPVVLLLTVCYTRWCVLVITYTCVVLCYNGFFLVCRCGCWVVRC